MAGFERSEHIDRSPEEVWSVFADPANTPRWMPDIKSCEPITDGPVGLGSKYRETRTVGKRDHTATLEITEFEEFRRYAGTVDESGMRGTYTYVFRPEDGGTRIDLTAELQGRGLMKLFVPFALRMMKKQDGDQLTRLKRLVEAS